MNFPSLYKEYLFYFHGNRDYFECHEVLEEHWKNNGMQRNSIWVGLIQVAVSFYHYRRGNVKGAMKMMDKAINILTYKEHELAELGLDYSQLLKKLHESRVNIRRNLPYAPINLPFMNLTLQTSCIQMSKKRGYEWGKLNDRAPYYLIHKHITRHEDWQDTLRG